MAGPDSIRAIRCACGKSLIWASAKGIEWQCRSCDRRLLVPFEDLAGLEHVERFVDLWRKKQKDRPSRKRDG
jgi:hypothetical protein